MRTLPRPGLVVALFLLVVPNLLATSVTATKDCIITPCTVVDASFSLATGQIVTWSATYSGMPPQGDKFYLSNGFAGNTADILLKNHLLAFDSGSIFLSAGNYSIAVHTALMGPGSYTINFNLTASASCTPSSHAFASLVAGSPPSAPFTFTIHSTGDLPISISSVTSSDAAHFPISSAPIGMQVPPDRTFQVRFDPGATSGSFSSTITVNATSVPPGTAFTPVTVTVSGTSLPPEPNIACAAASCGAAAVLATADGDAGASADFNVGFQNTGTAPLNITAINLFNDTPGGTFSFVTPPSTASVAAGGSRNVSVHFVPPPGEATYCGHLEIHSNDPDTPVKSCFFKARGHHPVPRMVITPATINYRDVELGFSFHQAIIVSNAGDAPLSVNATSCPPPSAPCTTELPQWSVVTTGPFTINPAAPPAVLEQTFTPTALGTHTITVRVTGNDLTNPMQDVMLTGNAIAPVPIDSVTVLDRSGSMADSAGPRRKIDALRTAVDLYTHLLRPETGSGTGDKLGIVKYNDVNEEYLAAALMTAAQLTLAEARLDAGSVSDPARLAPQGSTGIGGAMQRAGNMLLPTSSTRKHVMVVLTDGIENVHPFVGEVLGGIHMNDPDLKIYSIGLGSSIQPTVLQQITNITNGYFQAADDLSGVSRFQLEAFYFKIFSNATGMSIVVDPTIPVTVSGPGTITVGRATIVSSDRTATFLVLDEPSLRAFYDLELVDPSGHVMNVGSIVGGVPIHVVRRNNYSLYRVVFPDSALAPQYVGDWILRLRSNGKWSVGNVRERYHMNPNADFINPFIGIVPVAFAAAVASDYRMDVSATPSSYLPGADVTMKASFTDRGWPSKASSITVDVRAPGGSETLGIPLYDDGTHGDAVAGDSVWSGVFANTPAGGIYRFLFHGVGITERGELAPRDEARYVALTPPTDGGGGPLCTACEKCDPRRDPNCFCFRCKTPEKQPK